MTSTPTDQNERDTAAPPPPTAPASGQGPRWPREAPEFRFLADPWPATSDSAKFARLRDITSSELGNWIDRLKTAGVGADRHNSPDLLEQLRAALRRPIDSVICGVLDVDPNACLNSALAARYPMELAAGVLIVGKITNARRIGVTTDARVPGNWLTALNRACDDLGVRVDRIINDYPQADPTLLMYTMLGRRLRPGRLPTDQGAVLLDAAAAVAVGRFALSDEPLRCAPLAVRDHVSNQSAYVAAPLGMTLAELLERLGMPWQDRILRGGDLLRDVRVSPDARVGCAELIYHSSGLSAALVPASCIRCGWCVDACPTNVQPATALEAAQRRDPDMAENAGIEACIECGICSYVCPSHLPLLEGIRQMKRLVHEEYRSDDATTG